MLVSSLCRLVVHLCADKHVRVREAANGVAVAMCRNSSGRKHVCRHLLQAKSAPNTLAASAAREKRSSLTPAPYSATTSQLVHYPHSWVHDGKGDVRMRQCVVNKERVRVAMNKF